jgi:hypothetical protein
MQPFNGARRQVVTRLWEDLHDRFAKECGWQEKHRVELDGGVLEDVQRTVGRVIGDQRGSAFLGACDLGCKDGQRDAARIRSASGAPSGAFLLTLPGPTTTLGDDTFTVAGRHRLGVGVRSATRPPPCFCGAGCAATPDHAMICKSIAKMTQLRHDIVASAVRRVICRATLPSSAEPLYRNLRSQARSGEAEGQRRGDILVVMPSGSITIVDVVITHSPADSYVKAASQTTGAAAQKAEDRKKAEFRKFGDAGQYDFVGFGLESHGRLGKGAVNFLKQVGEVAAARGNLSRTAFVASAYREISCALQQGNGLMYGRSGFHLARANGRQFMPGCEVAVQDEAVV